MWAIKILESSVGESTTFSNKCNNLSLNYWTSAKDVFFNLSKSSIRSSLKLFKFPGRFEFSIALCFLRERHVLFEMRLHFTEPFPVKEARFPRKFLQWFSLQLYLSLIWILHLYRIYFFGVSVFQSMQ